MRRLPEPDPGQPDARSATRYLLWLMRNERKTIIGGMFFGVLWMVSQALMPAVIGRTIDVGITHRDSGELVRWSAVVLALGVTTATAGILRHRNALVNFLAAAYITVQVVTRQAVKLGATLPKLVAAGDVVAIGTSDIAEIGGGLDVTARLSGAIVAIFAVAIIMLTTSVPLGLIVLFGVPVLTALTGFLLRPLHERQRQFRTRQGELTARAIDIASGLRVLRGIGGEAAFAERYRRESQGLRAAAVAVTRVESGLAAVEVLMPGVIVAGVTFLAARFAIDGQLTVGELVAFYGYAAFLATPLRTLMEGADNITRAHVAARRVVRILNLSPEIYDSADDLLADELPSAAVLAEEESGLRIAPGSLFAVVCADPSDADALAERLARFEDAGRPTLGGVPLSAVPVREVRKRILLARNSDRFFNGTLRDELDVSGRATDLEVDAAIDAASARDVVEALPNGLATEVVDGGRTFSGGQLQRLRLARALLARREITLLVEPTSAVDAHTEARIAENLAALHAGGRGQGAGAEERAAQVDNRPALAEDRVVQAALAEDRAAQAGDPAVLAVLGEDPAVLPDDRAVLAVQAEDPAALAEDRAVQAADPAVLVEDRAAPPFELAGIAAPRAEVAPARAEFAPLRVKVAAARSEFAAASAADGAPARASADGAVASADWVAAAAARTESSVPAAADGAPARASADGAVASADWVAAAAARTESSVSAAADGAAARASVHGAAARAPVHGAAASGARGMPGTPGTPVVARSAAEAATRTTVVFTSSPLLLDRAHGVAYVEDGHVVAVGTHRDLLSAHARYAAVVTRGEDE